MNANGDKEHATSYHFCRERNEPWEHVQASTLPYTPLGNCGNKPEGTLQTVKVSNWREKSSCIFVRVVC